MECHDGERLHRDITVRESTLLPVAKIWSGEAEKRKRQRTQVFSPQQPVVKKAKMAPVERTPEERLVADLKRSARLACGWRRKALRKKLNLPTLKEKVRSQMKAAEKAQLLGEVRLWSRTSARMAGTGLTELPHGGGGEGHSNRAGRKKWCHSEAWLFTPGAKATRI